MISRGMTNLSKKVVNFDRTELLTSTRSSNIVSTCSRRRTIFSVASQGSTISIVRLEFETGTTTQAKYEENHQTIDNLPGRPLSTWRAYRACRHVPDRRHTLRVCSIVVSPDHHDQTGSYCGGQVEKLSISRRFPQIGQCALQVGGAES